MSTSLNILVDNEKDQSSKVSIKDDDRFPMLVDRSLGLLPLESLHRQWLIKICCGSTFDSFILAIIIINSISMACKDYRTINENYEPDVEHSIRNFLLDKAEVVFTIIFVIECLMKILAFGFIFGKKAYLRSAWNVFDFVIILSSIVSMLPFIPNLSMLRSLRVLRPLKSVSKLPGLRKIIVALVDSADDLCNIMFLLIFLITCFSIMGLLLWNGLLHTRCRLTPFPVKLPSDCYSVYDTCWTTFLKDVIENPDEHRCLPDPNDDPIWTQSTSPWLIKGPQNCTWPLDNDDERICSLSAFGQHLCQPLYTSTGAMINRTCGSNYDRFGNPRFVTSNEPYGYNHMSIGTYSKELNWGLTNFDSFFSAFVTTFQVITLEGWTDIMSQILNAWHFAPTVFIFSLEVILCGYIVLNLVLAVITKSLDNTDDSVISDSIVDNNSVETKNGRVVKIRYFVEGRFHKIMIMACVVFNAIVLSLDYYGMPEKQADILERINTTFTIIFFVDVILCNLAYGVRTYWRDPLMCFDGVIGIISVVELIVIFNIPSESAGSSAFSIFRSLRLFRVFKMAKNWKSLQSLLQTMLSSVKEIGNFAVLLLLFVFIYSLVGMQLLSNRLHFSSDTGVIIGRDEEGYDSAIIPRAHFDTFLWSMLTVFQMLTGENWNNIMYDGWRTRGPIAVIYMLSLLVIGGFIVMNLFLAILLKKFEDSFDLMDDSKIDLMDDSKIEEQVISKVMQPEENRKPSVIQLFWVTLTKNNFVRKLCFKMVESSYFELGVTFLIIGSSLCLAFDNPLDDPNSSQATILYYCDIMFTFLFILEMLVKILAYGLIFENGSYLKNTWNILDFIIIIISTLNLLELGPGSSLRALRTLRVLRPLRMVQRLPELKVVVDSLLLSFPSVADVAVLCTLFFLIFSSFGVNFLKGCFYHCSGQVFDSLPEEQMEFITNPPQWREVQINQRLWFNAEVLGCGVDYWNETTILKSKDVCDCLAPGEWKLVVPQNFDNVLNGMALLFEIATTEGWVDVMYAAIDQRGEGMQPVRDSNPLWAVFFIVFLIFGAFFILELFVGVTIDNFNRIKERTGRGLMTEAQRQWAATQTFAMKIKPEKRSKRPEDYFRGRCYDFVISSNFEQFITFCIIASSALAACIKFGDSIQKTKNLEYCNLILSVIFTIEMILKLISLGKKYFDDGWNRFDFVIISGTNIFAIIGLFVPQSGAIASFLRLLRVCRLFRLINRVKKLRTLFNTLIVSLPSIVNIGTLILLLFFIYATIGMQLFSFIPNNEEVDEHANFRSFTSSMFLLLRFSTGENWNGFMRSIIPSSPGCVKYPSYNPDSPWCLRGKNYPNCTEINGCGAGLIAFVYFYSFTLLVSFVILNLFVAIVLEAFEKSNEGDILSPSDMSHFTQCWAEFDPSATWRIKVVDMKRFLIKLGSPLGVPNGDLREAEKFLKDESLKDLPVNCHGEVNIVHVASHLAKRLTKLKQGEDFHELSNDHPIQKKIAMSIHESDRTLNEVYIERSRKKLRVLRAFVRAKISPETMV